MQTDTLIIERLDGKLFELERMGIRVISFNPPGPNRQTKFESIGPHKTLLVESTVQQLTIPLSFNVEATDNYDYELQRLAVLDCFNSDEPFYIYTSRMPYLRWKVVAESFAYNRLRNFWLAENVSINLVCAEGYAETTHTTLDNFTMTQSDWGLGLGIPLDKKLTYAYANEKEIEFYNPGAIPLLSEEHPVTIHFRGEVPTKLSIKNLQTNQVWELTHSLKTTDKLIISGMIPTVNDQLVFHKSNHSYLDFKRGTNTLEITGATTYSIAFDTRFYY